MASLLKLIGPSTHMVPVTVSSALLSSVKNPGTRMGPKLAVAPFVKTKSPEALHVGGAHVPPEAAASRQSWISPSEIGSSSRGGVAIGQFTFGHAVPCAVVFT